jgi:nicotianamine synthase
MAAIMGNVCGTEKLKNSEHATSHTTLETPPRTPTALATSAQALASEIRNIHHSLSELPDLAPGDRVNSLLTRLVSLCVIPYSDEFVAYFSNIEGIDTLCKKLRPLCATAEGELEKFWARKIVNESCNSIGTYSIT